MSDGYRVERHEHGIVVMGSIPVSDMCHLLKGWAEDQRYDIVDAIVAQHFGASMAVTTKEGSRLWRRQLGLADDNLNDGAGCPGAGRCHGSLGWCERCGNVEFTCDEHDCDLHRERREARDNINTCPDCGEPTDNGHDREYPPNPYPCSKCAAKGDL